jgi:predicted NBD/HSP70 family sugar kinase
MAEQATSLTRSEGAVLQAIRTRGQTTRAHVASAVDLSPAMTARVVAHLQEIGLVREAGRSIGAGPGRQALLLELQPDAAAVAAVDIGTEVLHLLMADLHGAPLLYREIPSSVLAGLSQPEIVATLASLIREMEGDAVIAPGTLAALGVSITGIIDGEQGRCLLRSNTPGWEDFPLGAMLGAALRLPVLLEETARAKSMAELRLGAADGDACPSGSFLYVDAGASIGSSLVIEGRPFRGSHGLAGELGHVTVDPGGALCRCGNRGCLQATASVRAILAHARDLLSRGVFSSLAVKEERLTLADLAAAAEAEDKLALGLLTEAGERLGLALSMTLNLLGLDLVVLGGALVQCSPVVLEAAARIVRLRVLPILSQPRVLVSSALGSDAASRGVALQAIDWLFAAPSERLLGHVAARGNGRLLVALGSEDC